MSGVCVLRPFIEVVLQRMVLGLEPFQRASGAAAGRLSVFRASERYSASRYTVSERVTNCMKLACVCKTLTGL